MIHIGISGGIAYGKSTLGAMLYDQLANAGYNVKVVPFAYGIKELAAIEQVHAAQDMCARVGARAYDAYQTFRDWGYSDALAIKAGAMVAAAMEKYPSQAGQKNRRLLQTIGSDIGRNCIELDIWLNRTRSLLSSFEYGISDDLRFDNEACAVDVHVAISTRGREEIYELRKKQYPTEYFYSDHDSEQSLTEEPDIIIPIGFTEEDVQQLVFNINLMISQNEVDQVANSSQRLRKKALWRTIDDIRQRYIP